MRDRLQGHTRRQAFVVGYQPRGWHDPVLTPINQNGTARMAGMEPRTSYRRESDTYTNHEERIAGFIMVNGKLTKKE